MPYITQEDRDRLALTYTPRSEGELNYMLCLMMSRFVQNGLMTYGRLNAAMGAHAGAGQEFYRRVVVPYEERKMRSNGDVF